MAQAFDDAMPKLAAFGKESTTVFKELQVNANKASMEVSEVLSIVEQFDTFDGAAKAVGRLNAILGGPFLNSLEMVTVTDPTERMRMLSAAVNDAGVSFDQMDYYQRKALASAMGVDEIQLAKMMRDGFDSAVPSVQKSQAELAAMADEAAKMQDIMAELAQTGRMLATSLLPIVQAVKSALNAFQSLNDWADGAIARTFPKLIAGLVGVRIAVIAVGNASANTPLGRIIVALTVFAAVMVQLIDVIPYGQYVMYGLAAAITAAAIAWAALNVASMGILPAIGLVATILITLGTAIMDIAGFLSVKTYSPGLIDMLGIAGKAFTSFAQSILYPIKMIGSLIMKIMELAFWLSPAGIVAQGLSYLFGGSSSVSAGGSSVSSTNTAQSASNRITGAQTASASPSEVSSGGKQQTDVNVTVKADEGDLIRLIIKTIEETQSFKAAGVPPKSNVIKSRVA